MREGQVPSRVLCFGSSYFLLLSHGARKCPSLSRTQTQLLAEMSTSGYQPSPGRSTSSSTSPLITCPPVRVEDKYAMTRAEIAICKVADSEARMRDNAMPFVTVSGVHSG